MKTLSLATVAAFLALAGAAAAQPVASPATDPVAVPASAQVVGRWLHDAQGHTIGSVRALADGGHSAVVMLGAYFQPGSHEVTVPARRLSIVDGRVTLQTETVVALNAPAR
jgi:hypothetical protein